MTQLRWIGDEAQMVVNVHPCPLSADHVNKGAFASFARLLIELVDQGY
jgi:hypothetical protein